MAEQCGEGRRKWFIPLEKKVLTALIDQHKDVVESKKRDGASNREKEKVWEVVAAQFSAHPATQARSARELRRCWENMKARAKKALENDRLAREGQESQTEASTITPEIEAVLNVLSPYDDMKNGMVGAQDILSDCLMSPEASTTTAAVTTTTGLQSPQQTLAGGPNTTSHNPDPTPYYDKLPVDSAPTLGPSKRTRKLKMDQLCDEDILLAQIQMQQAQMSIENLRLERKLLQERYQQQREAHEWQRAQHEANLQLAMLQLKFWEKKTGYGDMEI